jgi:hypothetical protein
MSCCFDILAMVPQPLSNSCCGMLIKSWARVRRDTGAAAPESGLHGWLYGGATWWWSHSSVMGMAGSRWRGILVLATLSFSNSQIVFRKLNLGTAGDRVLERGVRMLSVKA